MSTWNPFQQSSAANPFSVAFPSALAGSNNSFAVASGWGSTASSETTYSQSNNSNSPVSANPFGGTAGTTNLLAQSSEVTSGAINPLTTDSAHALLSAFATSAQSTSSFAAPKPSQTSSASNSSSSAFSFNFCNWNANSGPSVNDQSASQSSFSFASVATAATTSSTAVPTSSTNGTFSFNFSNWNNPSTKSSADETTGDAVSKLSSLPGGFWGNSSKATGLLKSSEKKTQAVVKLLPSDCHCEDCANSKLIPALRKPSETNREFPPQQIFIPFAPSKNSVPPNLQQNPNRIANMASVLIPLVSEYLNDASALAWGCTSHFFIKELKRFYKLKQLVAPRNDQDLLGLSREQWPHGVNLSLFYRLIAPVQQRTQEDVRQSHEDSKGDDNESDDEVDDDYIIDGLNGPLQEMEFVETSEPSEVQAEMSAKMAAVQSDICDRFAIGEVQHLNMCISMFAILREKMKSTTDDCLIVGSPESELPTFAVSHNRMQHAFNQLHSLNLSHKGDHIFASDRERASAAIANLAHAWDPFIFSSLTELTMYSSHESNSKLWRLPCHFPQLKKLVLDLNLSTEAFFPSLPIDGSKSLEPFVFPPSLTELDFCLKVYRERFESFTTDSADWLRLPPALQRLEMKLTTGNFHVILRDDEPRIPFPPLPFTLTYLNMIDSSRLMDWKTLNTRPLPHLKTLRLYRFHEDIGHLEWRTFCPNLERLFLTSSVVKLPFQQSSYEANAEKADSFASFKRYQPLPQSLRVLQCDTNFGQEFHHLALPDSIRILILGSGFKGTLNNVRWPLQLTHLHMRMEDATDIYPDFSGRSTDSIPVEWNGCDFPPSLQSLNIGRTWKSLFVNLTEEQIVSLLTTGPFEYWAVSDEVAQLQSLKFPPSLRHMASSTVRTPFSKNELSDSLHRLDISAGPIRDSVYGLDSLETNTTMSDSDNGLQNVSFPNLKSLCGVPPDFRSCDTAASWRLPLNLERIKFKQFNLPLKDLATGTFLRLPASLTSIDLGDCFNQDIRGFEWPPLLESLTLHAPFNQPIDDGFRISHCLHLRSLTFGNEFSQCVRRLVLPPNLESLTFGQRFHHLSIAHLVLPEKLRKLEFLFNRLPQGTTSTPFPLVFFRAILRMQVPRSCTHVVLPRNGIPTTGAERKELFESDDMQRWVTPDGRRKFFIVY